MFSLEGLIDLFNRVSAKKCQKLSETFSAAVQIGFVNQSFNLFFNLKVF
jgi:hypothetical protein